MTAILILAGVGFLLVLVEMFLPGGVLGALGGILLLAAIATGYAQLGAFGGTITFAAIALVCIVGFVVWMNAFPKTAVGRKLILGRNLDRGPEREAESPLLGKEGVTQTPLRPAGKAVVDGRRIDVVAESGFVDAGEAVSVVLVDGTRVVVRKKVGVVGNPA
jgi:Membrane-bound serine protease (ClpP class)